MTNAVINSPPEIMLAILICPKMVKRQDLIPSAVLDILDEECAAHFEKLKASLEAMGIPYEVDKGIVRGLDYYTRTVFEFESTSLSP